LDIYVNSIVILGLPITTEDILLLVYHTTGGAQSYFQQRSPWHIGETLVSPILLACLLNGITPNANDYEFVLPYTRCSPVQHTSSALSILGSILNGDDRAWSIFSPS